MPSDILSGQWRGTARGGQRRFTGAAYLLPSLMALLAIFISKAPISLWFGAVPMPCFIMIVIFFWSSADENYLPVWYLFLLGLFEDLLMGTPIGLWALVFTLMHGYVASQKQILATSSFMTNWITFGVLTALIYVLVYSILGFDIINPPAIAPLFIPFMMTLIFFPLITRLLSLLENFITTTGIGD